MYTIVRELTVAVYKDCWSFCMFIGTNIQYLSVFAHVWISCLQAHCEYNKKDNNNQKNNKSWILLSLPTEVFSIWHPSSCQSVALKRDKDKRVNTEFTVYYQVLENLQTSSQLQVFRHKPVKRSQDWPILTSGKIWQVEREANIFKVSGDLHILNYIHFNKLKKGQIDLVCI